MNWPKDFIYLWLSTEIPVKEYKVFFFVTRFNRPVFYRENMFLRTGDFAVVSSEDMEKLAKSDIFWSELLVICVGMPPHCAMSLNGTIWTVSAAVQKDQLFNCLQRIFDRLDDWDRHLKEICLLGGGFSDLLDACDPVVLDPIAVFDREYQYVAYSGLSYTRGLVEKYVSPDNRVIFETVNDLITSGDFVQMQQYRDVYVFDAGLGETLCQNLFCEGKYIGRVNIIKETDDICEMKYNKVVLKHLSPHVELLYERHMSFDCAYNHGTVFKKILTCILNGISIPDAQIERVLSENGWDKTDILQLIQLEPVEISAKSHHTSFFSTIIESTWRGSICFTYLEKFYLLLNHTRFYHIFNNDFHQSLAYFLRENLLVAGLSRRFQGIMNIPAGCVQTQIAIDYGRKKTPTAWYFDFEDHVMDYMLKNASGSLTPEQVCSEELLTVWNYDRKNGTRYLETIDAYLSCQLNAVEAARQLHIQRSSLLYRLRRIQSLAEIDFLSKEKILYLVLSCKMLLASVSEK